MLQQIVFTAPMKTAGCARTKKRKKWHKSKGPALIIPLTQKHFLAMVAQINMFFRLGDSEELICGIAMSRVGGTVNYELKSTVDVFTRSASIIALM
jgi:hypothetical protein